MSSAISTPVKINSVIDNTGETDKSIPFLGSTNDTTPTLHGTAPAYSQVYIYAHQRYIGTAQADAEGNWEFTPTLPLGYGGQVFSVMSQSQMSDPFVVTVQSQPITPVTPAPAPTPDPIVIPDPVTPPKPATLAITNVSNLSGDTVVADGTTDGNTVRLSGIAPAPYATVQLYANGREVAMITADGEGKWSYESTLTTGSNLLKVASRGQWSEAFTVDVQPAGTPVTPAEPAPEPAPEPTPSPAPAVVITTVNNQSGDSVAAGGVTSGNTVLLSGTAPAPFATIQVYANGREIAMITADSEGKWSYEPTLGLGINELKIASRGQFSKAFTIDVQASAPPAEPAPEPTPAPTPEPTPAPTPEPTPEPAPVPGDGAMSLVVYDKIGTAEFLNNGDTTDDRKPALSGMAEPNSLVIIYVNERVVGEAVTNEGGYWGFSPVLEDGPNSLRVTSADGSTSSDNFVVVVEAPTSAHLSIDRLFSTSGMVEEGGMTSAGSFTLGGSAQPNTTVEVYLNGSLFGTAPVSIYGTWGMPATFPYGDNTLRIKVGNEFSESFSFHKQSPFAMFSMSDFLSGESDALFAAETLSELSDATLTLDLASLEVESSYDALSSAYSANTYSPVSLLTPESLEEQYL